MGKRKNNFVKWTKIKSKYGSKNVTIKNVLSFNFHFNGMLLDSHRFKLDVIMNLINHYIYYIQLSHMVSNDLSLVT